MVSSNGSIYFVVGAAETDCCPSRSPPIISLPNGNQGVTYGHLRNVMKIFGSAVAGTAMQLVAVGFMTGLFYLLARARYFSLGWPLALCDQNTACQTATPLVRLSYLMTAVGIVLTDNRYVARTALWARHASRAIRPNEPRFLAEAVAAQLLIVAIACIVQELASPWQPVVVLGQSMGGVWLGAILWPAAWSIVVAATGSLAHALFLSILSTRSI